MSHERIVDLAALQQGDTHRFAVTDDNECYEVILLLTESGPVAWENYCQHWTDTKLDRGSGASIRGDELVCDKHGATFEIETGYCTAGPCQGAYLTEVDVTIKDDAVYLVDERYTFLQHGGCEESETTSRSSRGGIGF